MTGVKARARAGVAMARRNDVAVKIDAEVARQAKIVAAFKDVSLAEFLSEALRPIVEKELVEQSARAAKGAVTPPKKGPKA